MPLWLSYLLVRFDALAQGASGEALRWIGVALLAAALAVVGSRPPSRLLWWPVVLAVAWLTGPVLTAAGYLEQLLGPGRGLDAARVVDALAATIDVFFAAASFAVRPVLPWLIAVAAGLCLAKLSRRRAAA